MENLKEKPKLLFKFNGTPDAFSIHKLTENVKNFQFIMIRLGISQGSNLDFGRDCDEFLISSERAGFIYHKYYTGLAVFEIYDDKIQFGADYSIGKITNGVSIFGINRI